MSRRCLFNSITAGLIVWFLIAAWYFDNGPMLILGLMAGLLWIWGVEVGSHVFNRDNRNAPARGQDARGRTTRS